jgi:hypothetical protein
MKIFLGGIAALVIGIILLVFWWWDFLTMLKGLIPIILLVGGGFAAYSGYDEIKERMTGEPEKFEPAVETMEAEKPAYVSAAAEEEKPEKPKAARPRRRGPRKKETQEKAS